MMPIGFEYGFRPRLHVVKTKAEDWETPSSGCSQAVRNGGLKRIDMIAAVLKRHRGLSVRELIAALDKEFGWKSTQSSVTAHLYTNQNRFVHTKPDRAAKRPVTWSLK